MEPKPEISSEAAPKVEPAVSPASRARLIWRLIGLSIGVLLVGAAVFVVLRERDQITAALDAVRAPSPIVITVLIGSVVANLVLSALTFSLLMGRFAPSRVGILEMQALICSTALVNYLPLRPGLFGRIAYHRAVNDIPILDSTRILIAGALLTLGAAAILACATVLAYWARLPLEILVTIPALLLAAVLLLMVVASGSGAQTTDSSEKAGLRPEIRSAVRTLALAAFIRYIEVLIWAVRYMAAFALMGSPIDAPAAIGFACVSILATMVPFVSNGLGLREWLIGLLAPILAGHPLELGLVAELLNRAAELLVVIVFGLLGLAYLARLRGKSPGGAPRVQAGAHASHRG